MVGEGAVHRFQARRPVFEAIALAAFAIEAVDTVAPQPSRRTAKADITHASGEPGRGAGTVLTSLFGPRGKTGYGHSVGGITTPGAPPNLPHAPTPSPPAPPTTQP